MMTAGVDLASQDIRTAACVIEWSDETACVTELVLGVDDAKVTDLIMGCDKTGIDSPLGWPIAFAEAVDQHSSEGTWPRSYDHSDTTSLRYRRTDLNVWRTLASAPPLSVSTDKIALPAMRAAALLSRLPSKIALDGTGTVVEVYPAAALRRWGLVARGYKGKDNSATRCDLVDAILVLTRGWLDVNHSADQLCRSNDDALDALIAALIARASALGMVDPIPVEEKASALREGWIALPTARSLQFLTTG